MKFYSPVFAELVFVCILLIFSKFIIYFSLLFGISFNKNISFAEWYGIQNRGGYKSVIFLFLRRLILNCAEQSPANNKCFLYFLRHKYALWDMAWCSYICGTVVLFKNEVLEIKDI